MKILYFTTTGNSLAVARAIGGELLSVVGLLVSGVGGLRDDDGVGVVCPVYFGELPLPFFSSSTGFGAAFEDCH